MSQAFTLARPYARAAFALAKERGDLGGWSKALAVAAQLVADPRVAALVEHPNLAAGDAAGLVAPPGDLTANFLQFLAVLAENRRLLLLPEILALFEEFRAEAQNTVRAKVTSALPLDEAALAKLRASLQARFQQNVELETAIDPGLIGGAVIDTGNVVIDGSVRSRLARLETALTH
ncbi:MAG TPA: F0F1 ATP synthase subunit delta [Xanthomonadaceae bacterium]|jgi:F-type H+-transporting ATPase subunit delta|nr:F0F1 ATP synthase subunit delta [Xanthomonadaceae bacterium]